MAIRLRKINGRMIALCAVESDPWPGDIYLDDKCHHALSMKFWKDFCAEGAMRKPEDPPIEWSIMDECKIRDAEEELIKWLGEKNDI